MDSQNVFTLFLGGGVRENVVVSTKYSHFNLLKTAESMFGVGNLGRKDKSAVVMTGWRK